MTLLTRLTLKNLKLNKKRTAVTVIGILLAVALITAAASLYVSAVSSLIKYETREKGFFHIALHETTLKKAEELKNNRAIGDVYLTSDEGFAAIDSKNPDKPYVWLKGFTAGAIENLSVKLVEGRLPSSSSEVLIPSHLITNGRVRVSVGDILTLDTGERVRNDDDTAIPSRTSLLYSEDGESVLEHISVKKSVTYTVVGVIERPASNIEPYYEPGYTLITLLDGDMPEKVDAYIRYTDEGVKKFYRVTAGILGVDPALFEKSAKGEELLTEEEDGLLRSQLEKAEADIDVNQYLITLQTDPLKISGIDMISYAVAIAVLIILVTSVFCIKNSFDISISEKIRQYGMLRSIGATRKQIRRNVLCESAILGAMGIPLGLLLGHLASFVLTKVSSALIGDSFSSSFSLEFTFSFPAVLAAILLGALTVWLSAYRSALKASKVTPVDSIRNSAEIKIDQKKLRTPAIVRKVFGEGGVISYKNLKRNRVKYRTTVISIVVSVVVFIALSSFMGMMFEAMEREISPSDYNIGIYAYNVDSEAQKKLNDTVRFDGVKDYIMITDAYIESERSYYSDEFIKWTGYEGVYGEGKMFSVFAINPEQFEKYCKETGLSYEEMKDKGIICDYETVGRYSENSQNPEKRYMRVNALEKGDTVSGKMFDKDFSLTVGAVNEERPFGLAYSGEMIVVCSDLIENVAPEKDRRVDVAYLVEDSYKFQDEIEEYLTGIQITVSNKDESYRQMNNLFILLSIFLYGFVIVISLIGLTNIFNTITTNVHLRRREFAALRSIGMTGREFDRMVRLESLFMGVRSLLFGVPVGLVLSYILYFLTERDAGMPYRFPLAAVLIACAVVFVMIFLIMSYSMRRVKRQNTIETIRNENI